MTDKQQPEAFCWATELAMVRDPVTLTVKEAREVSDEMQRMHAELETLRAKLKTYEDLGDAGSDVQLLRTGYDAARLEIESLQRRVQEVGAVAKHEHERAMRAALPALETLAVEQLAAAPTTQPVPKQEPTCKENLQVQVWVIPNGAGGGQFSWAPQDERYWTKLTAQAAQKGGA